ncbi:MAG: PIG-L family deacetylase [Thermoanaerobaculia bacterium]
MKSFRRMLRASILLLAAAGAGAQDKAAPGVPRTFPGVSSVLWIAAHPDDEVLAAPLLGRLCLDEGLRCSFLVFTRGEKGDCLLPGGCRPDLGTVRAAEMARAAQLFHAGLTLWSLPDSGAAPDGSAGAWDAAAGSHAALLASLRSVITQTRADLVLTLDPRHGSTCHPDHRAVGGLVREAISTMQKPPGATYLLETRLVEQGSPVMIHFLPAASAGAGVFAFDGNPGWKMTNADVQSHTSQFDARLRRAVSRVPPAERAVYLGPADLLLASDDVWDCR